ncbi:MAG: hypothetical protein CW348_00375 [Thermobifida sp.]|nr:hypothetical protein [Thermobifida sp.]
MIFALGGLAHGAVPRLLFEAFMRIPTWLALLLFYLFPVLVHVGEHVLGRHPLGRRRALTVAVTLAGAALDGGEGGTLQQAGGGVAAGCFRVVRGGWERAPGGADQCGGYEVGPGIRVCHVTVPLLCFRGWRVRVG